MPLKNNTFSQTLCATLFSLSAFGITQAHAADSGTGYITDANPKPLVVLSNGQEYTNLDHDGSINIVGRLEYDTGTAGRIKSWWAKPKMTNGYSIESEVPGMQAYKQSQSYPIGNRPKSLNKNLIFSRAMPKSW